MHSENHKQLELNFDNKSYFIDEGIVDIIKLIWNQDYDIYNCCEDYFGNIYIEFPDIDQFQDLIQKAHEFHLENFDKLNSETLNKFLRTECSISSRIHDNGYFNLTTNQYQYGMYTFLVMIIAFNKNSKDKFIKLWNDVFKETKHTENINEIDSEPDEIETFMSNSNPNILEKYGNIDYQGSGQ